MNWFQLNVAGNPTQPNAYTDLGAGTPSCPTGTNKICAIQADPDGSGNPVITDSLKDDMITALHNRNSSATVQLKILKEKLNLLRLKGPAHTGPICIKLIKLFL